MHLDIVAIICAELQVSRGTAYELMREAVNKSEHYRCVPAGVLKMVCNALDRDAEEGKVSRKEMKEELLKD